PSEHLRREPTGEMGAPRIDREIPLLRFAYEGRGGTIATVPALRGPVEIDGLPAGPAEPGPYQLCGSHLVLACDLETSGVAAHFDRELPRRAPLLLHLLDFVAELTFDRGEVSVLVEEARPHPDAHQIRVPGAEAEPASHLEKRVIGVARAEEVGDHQPFERESAREGASADGDDGLGFSGDVDESVVGPSVVDLHDDVRKDLRGDRPELIPFRNRLAASERCGVVDLFVEDRLESELLVVDVEGELGDEARDDFLRELVDLHEL